MAQRQDHYAKGWRVQVEPGAHGLFTGPQNRTSMENAFGTEAETRAFLDRKMVRLVMEACLLYISGNVNGDCAHDLFFGDGASPGVVRLLACREVDASGVETGRVSEESLTAATGSDGLTTWDVPTNLMWRPAVNGRVLFTGKGASRITGHTWVQRSGARWADWRAPVLQLTLSSAVPSSESVTFDLAVCPPETDFEVTASADLATGKGVRVPAQPLRLPASLAVGSTLDLKLHVRDAYLRPATFTIISGPGTLASGVLTATGAGSIVVAYRSATEAEATSETGRFPITAVR
ncbi:MAG: hypothetical protein H0W41_05575 [Chloroflexi bacterium]|nr:hypothetical protein [Chloroflexota bacterium]